MERNIKPNQCTNCKARFGYKISHLRKNNQCTEFYVNLYKDSTNYRNELENSEDVYRTLSRIFKVEYMKERRNNLDKKEWDNLNRKESRELAKVNIKNCLSNYLNTIEVALSKECYFCHSLRNPQEVEVLEESYGNVICNICKELEKGLSHHQNLMDELQRIREENKYTENSMLGIYDKVDNRTRHIVYYPRFGNGENRKFDGEYDKKNVCVVIPQDIFNKNVHKKVNTRDVKLITYSKDTPMIDSANMLLNDMLEKSRSKVNNRNIKNSIGRIGIMKNGNLKLSKKTSYKGCLKDIKGSTDNFEMNVTNLLIYQEQNGKNNVLLNWEIFQGQNHNQSDENMALFFLRQKGYEFSYTEESSNSCLYPK